MSAANLYSEGIALYCYTHSGIRFVLTVKREFYAFFILAHEANAQ